MSISTTNDKSPVWQSPDGTVVSCTEKLKVLQQNVDELLQVAQDAFEDGVLMGVDAKQLKQCFADLMLNLKDISSV